MACSKRRSPAGVVGGYRVGPERTHSVSADSEMPGEEVTVQVTYPQKLIEEEVPFGIRFTSRQDFARGRLGIGRRGEVEMPKNGIGYSEAVDLGDSPSANDSLICS